MWNQTETGVCFSYVNFFVGNNFNTLIVYVFNCIYYIYHLSRFNSIQLKNAQDIML